MSPTPTTSRGEDESEDADFTVDDEVREILADAGHRR